MEWKSRRIEAILEQALVEDKATSDITTSLTIEPGLRAAALYQLRHQIFEPRGKYTSPLQAVVHGTRPWR